MKALLIFHSRLEYSRSLLEGRLLLIDASTTNLLNTYIAASGLPTYQNANDTSKSGLGSIPQTIDVEDIYQVNTNPLSLLDVKGVEGSFYQISPPTVTIGVK